MTIKFTRMVTALENVGFVGHKAYELANQVELAYVDNFHQVATAILKEEKQTEEALAYDEEDEFYD